MVEPKPNPSVSEQLDRKLAAAALEKKQRGETPAEAERRALKRIERQREEEQRWACYGTIPKKDWVEMSGRPAQVLNQQADRYGLPLRGKTISLPALARAFHDLLARYARAFDDRDRGTGDRVSESEARRRRVAAQAEREELRLQRERRDVIPVTEANEQRHALIRWFVAVMEQAGMDLQAITRDRKVRRQVDDYFNNVRRLAADRADKKKGSDNAKEETRPPTQRKVGGFARLRKTSRGGTARKLARTQRGRNHGDSPEGV